MATEISRSLAEIDTKVKSLNKSLREGATESKVLDAALKLDPADTEAVVRKMGALQESVGQAAQKVALLKEKQEQAAEAFLTGDVSASELKKIEVAVLRAQNEVKGLNQELARTQQKEFQQASREVDRLTDRLGRAQNVARTLAKTATAIAGALIGAASAFVVLGNELHDTSTRFRITAEQLQLNRNLFAQVTDSAENYDAALSSLNRMMAMIAEGRGQRFYGTLEQLGVATRHANGQIKTAAELYDDMIRALARVSCESERAAMASVIFGENGLNVATVAGLTADEVQTMNARLEQTGIVSSEAARQADYIANRMHELRQQTQAASAELMVALLPVLLQLIEIAQVTIIPILQTLAEWFDAMGPRWTKFIFILLIILMLLPKLIGIIKMLTVAWKAVAVAKKAAGVAALFKTKAIFPLIKILLVVAAVIMIVVALFRLFTRRARENTDELANNERQLGNLQDQYNSMNANMGGTAYFHATNHNKQTVKHEVEISATGDTPISQASADAVAASLADRINAQLGGKI